MDDQVLHWINSLSHQDAVEAFRRCCGASTWCEKMAKARPYQKLDALNLVADTAFDSLVEKDWLEAFACHPKIGDLESLKMKFAGNREWSSAEQASITDADKHTLHRLAEGNIAYETRFGYLFIVCASGKSAAEMLSLLEARLPNKPETELSIAAAEQRKITSLRLAKIGPLPETD